MMIKATTSASEERLPFVKMHGLGNDFVVFDGRSRAVRPSAEQVRAIADRHTGVGCDQFIVIEPPVSALADAFMRISNADGSEIRACGNASRCVASLLMAEKKAENVIIETVAGLLYADSRGDGLVRVDMGRVSFDWRDIPLSKPTDTLHITAGPLRDGVAVNLGNPHAVFFVSAAAAVPLEAVGPAVENDPMFPEGANLDVAEVLAPDRIYLRVWERGVGVTRACGSGACATLAAAARRGLAGRSADVIFDSGSMHIDWLKDDHAVMIGPVATSFTGTIDGAMLGVPQSS